MPGRERDWDVVFKQALDYTVAIGGSAIHCMAGAVPPEQRPAAERTFIANLTRAADLAADKNITLLIEPINPRDRPDYFLTRARAGRRHHRQGRHGRTCKIQFDFYHVQIVSGDLITRFEKHLPLIGHVQIAAVPSRAEPDEGEINYPASLRGARPARLVGLDRLRIPAPRRAPRTASAGAGLTASCPAGMSAEATAKSTGGTTAYMVYGGRPRLLRLPPMWGTKAQGCEAQAPEARRARRA